MFVVISFYLGSLSSYHFYFMRADLNGIESMPPTLCFI